MRGRLNGLPLGFGGFLAAPASRLGSPAALTLAGAGDGVPCPGAWTRCPPTPVGAWKRSRALSEGLMSSRFPRGRKLRRVLGVLIPAVMLALVLSVSTSSATPTSGTSDQAAARGG